jgi:hypothetical protein
MNRLRAWLQVRPMYWSADETFVMRFFFAIVLYFVAIHWELSPSYAEVPKPNGLARLIPLGWMADSGLVGFFKPVVGLGLLAYILGLAPAVTLFPALLVGVGTGALRNSQGDISHHSQLAMMVLLAQWLVYVVHAVRVRSVTKVDEAVHSRAVWWSVMTIAAGYVASGIVKLKATDFQWIQRVPVLAVQSIKANLSQYYSTLVPAEGFKLTVVPDLIVKYPNVARLFFGTGLVLEVLGFLLLLNRPMCRWFGVALLLMHVGIAFLMEIEFWNHMWLLLIFCINAGEWLGLAKAKAAAAGKRGVKGKRGGAG